MNKFFEWAFDYKTPFWVTACMLTTMLACALLYLFAVITLFEIGQGFGGALMIGGPLAVVWWRVIALYRARRGDQ